MKTVLIGSGNVATCLGVQMRQCGVEIGQVLARNAATGQALADRLQCGVTDDPQYLDRDADVYIVAVQDAVLPQVVENILPYFPQQKIIAHTTGSASIQVLEGFRHYGVLYPLQSLRRENAGNITIPLLVDGNEEAVKKTLLQLAQTISPVVELADDDKRQKLHVAAVFTSNFSNYLLALGQSFCEEQHLSFYSLLPLIRETVNRIEKHLPSQMQTGPAIRGDENTIERHQKLLAQDPELLEVYQFLTDKISKSTIWE